MLAAPAPFKRDPRPFSRVRMTERGAERLEKRDTRTVRTYAPPESVPACERLVFKLQDSSW